MLDHETRHSFGACEKERMKESPKRFFFLFFFFNFDLPFLLLLLLHLLLLLFFQHRIVVKI